METEVTFCDRFSIINDLLFTIHMSHLLKITKTSIIVANTLMWPKHDGHN